MERKKTKLERATWLFANLSRTLISSGANTNRTLRNVNRIAQGLGYTCHTMHSYAGIMLTVVDEETQERDSQVIEIQHHGINFNTVSEISILSWDVVEKKLTLQQVENRLEDIQGQKKYNSFLVWVAVSIAGAALCRIFEGDGIEMAVTAIATFIGLIGRYILLKNKYNLYISWLVGAFISVSIVNFSRIFGHPLESALATCVLWMIPGVPLINGLLDMLSGHLIAGFAKYVNAMMMIFMIAVGYFLSLVIFGYGFID